MTSRRLPLAKLAALGLLLVVPPAEALTFTAIAFGDSVTEGYGDSGGNGGYPGRLQRWLRQRGYDATVVNEGVGGEATPEGLARIDQVLDQHGGEYFLLMEGTNDISRRISVETIRFNLNKLAERAEARGMRVVHASVIPRIPTAAVDASNEKTGDLAGAVGALASSKFRSFVDNFGLFESLPNLFDNYYFYDPLDPVGHPNSAGYQEMGGAFLEAMLDLLTSPQLAIQAPPQPIATGAVVSFLAAAGPEFTRLVWDFGDGGWAASDAPPELSEDHLYLAAGSYTVRLTGYLASGGTVSTEVGVTVEGTAPAWLTHATLLPLALQGDGTATDDVEARLTLQNLGGVPAVAEVAFYPEVRLDAPPAPRKLYLPAGSSTSIEDVLSSLFGLERARGCLLLSYFVTPGGAGDDLVSYASLRLAGGGSGTFEDDVFEIGSEHWSSVQKVIGGISGTGATTVDLAVANLDGVGGYVALALYDSGGALVDSAIFEMEVGAVRFRSLSDLFRGLAARPQPFTAVFLASGIRFAAATVLIDPLAGQVVVLESSP